MDAGALELHLRRLPGVVACQLTAGEAVLLLSGGDPAAVRVAAQAALDQAGSGRALRVLSTASPAESVPVWRRRRFVLLAGAAGALSAGIAAASTLASMPGAVTPVDETAVAVLDAPAADGARRAVRTQVPAPRTTVPDAEPIAGEVTDAPADPPAADHAVLGASRAPAAVDVDPAPPPAGFGPPAPAPPAEPPDAPAPAPPAPPPDVAAATADDDSRRANGRGRPDDQPEHPHGQPPGYLMRAGHGPW